VLRAVLRTAAAHKGRLLLSALAVVLGVAFVAGTYVFTDTLQRTFADLFGQTEPDVLVSAASELEAQQTTVTAAALPGSALEVLRGVDGVARAGGLVQVNGVTLVGTDGTAIGVTGAPTFGVSWSDDPDLSPLRLVDGRPPQGPEEIAIDTEALESGGFALGDTIRVLTPGPTVTATLVGVFRYGTSGNLAGATLTAFEPAQAQQLLLGGDRWTDVRGMAEQGVGQGELADRVEQAFSASDVGPVDVRTGEQASDDATEALTEGLGFITTFLLVFAGISLFVGAFIIVNTFSVLIARRTRELALLRAVGASRRQITVSVLTEALLVGLVGGVVGLGLGVLLALGLRELFALVGFEIPAGGIVVLPRTVVVAVVVGVLLTMVAAWLPARRAGSVPPMAALRDDVVLPTRSLRVRTAVGAVLLLLGAVLLAGGLSGRLDNGIAFVGAGLLLVFVAVALLAAVLGGPVTAALGAPVSRSAVGRLAVRNAQRDRRRTAATAGALMIGLALVTMIGVLGASSTRSVEATLDDILRADYIVTSTTFQPFSTELGDAIEAVDEVAVVSRIGSAPVVIGTPPADAAGAGPRRLGGTSFASSVQPETILDVLDVPVRDGSIDSLAQGALALDADTAAEQGVGLGDPVTLTWASGPRDYQVGAILGSGTQLTGATVSREEFLAVGEPAQDQVLYVAADPDADTAAVRQDLDAIVADYPIAQLLDQTEFADQVRGQVNQLLSLVYALLGLAVVIAVLGIVNTLVLSVLERTREIGLLHAVGTSRRQLRRMVRVEAVLIALFGALLGVGLGLAFGVAVQRSLADEGIDRLAVPWTLVGIVLVVSAVVGVLAAIVPARRAATLDVLAAIASE
jgi:putative ABC transport system permease protein